MSKKPYDRPTRRRASDDVWVHDRAPGMPAAVVNSTGNRPHPASSNSKLVVSNLHYNVTPKDLISIFGQVGTLTREPHIKYDRSGRSTGMAFVTFETPMEATRAKKQFDGILAKGQAMKVTYDTTKPHPKGRSASSSLVDRIQKPNLLERLSSDVQMNERPSTAQQQQQQQQTVNGGPVRTRNRKRGGEKGPAVDAANGGKWKKENKTAEELDKELDAYLASDAPSTVVEALSVADVTTSGDVEMA